MCGLVYDYSHEVEVQGKYYTVYSLASTKEVSGNDGVSCAVCGKPATGGGQLTVVQMKQSDSSQTTIMLHSPLGKEVVKAFLSLADVADYCRALCQHCFDKWYIDSMEKLKQ